APVADRDPLEATEGGRERLQAGCDLRQRHAELPGERGRSDGVVDVVEAGQRQADGSGTFRRHQLEAGAVEAEELDPTCRHVEQRTSEVAEGTRVLAEV